MKNWTDRFPRLSRLDQGLKGRIETNSNIIFFKKNSLVFLDRIRTVSCAVSIGVDPVYGRPCVLRRPEPHARAQCTDGDVKGLVVSPCGLGQVHLIKCQIRHCPPQTRVLRLKQLQSLQLIAAHAAILVTPAIICLNCNTNLTNRIR